MPRQHQIDENLKYLPHFDQSGHFLPSLSSQHFQQQNFHSHNRGHQTLPANALQRQLRQIHASHGQQPTDVYHSQPLPPHVSHTYQSPTHVPQNRPQVSSSVPSSSHITMVHSDDTDHKLDRKSKARRQLVCGLISATSSKPGRPVQRSQSFNTNSYSSARHDVVHRSGNIHRSHDTGNDKRTHSKSTSKQNVASKNLSKERTREAIENWNDLVHELHSEQFRQQQDERGHLTVLSDNSSEASFTYPIKDKKPDYSSQSPFKTFRGNTSLSSTSVKFPIGLGFTRYRPITPNLLDRLDKQKVAPRRRTQMWINKLPDQRRSHLGSSFPGPPMSEEKNNEENKVETKGTADDVRSGSQAQVYSSCTLENSGNNIKRWHEFI